MATFENLNRQAFESNPIQEFRRVAGGLPDAHRKYSSISSNDKKNILLWNFFSSEFVTDNMLDAKTVYSGNTAGVTIREMVDYKNDGNGGNDIHSIDYVVPKSTYERALTNRLSEQKSNGASINPLNFLPSHRNINSRRRARRIFDFDGDTVESETLAKVDGDSRRFQAGVDEDGNWVGEPLMTRGDIARCVMYMEFMYELNYVNEVEMGKLQEWMKEDEPSDYEREFGKWIRQTKPLGMNIQNPFVSNPELATDERMFQKLLNSYLQRNGVEQRDPNDEDPHPDDFTEDTLSIIIDSVLPNPRRIGEVGKEIITLRNTSATAVNLEGWTLRIATETHDNLYSLGGLMNGRAITDFSFAEDNVLSNSRRTTIILCDGRNNFVSEFQYARRDARPHMNFGGSGRGKGTIKALRMGIFTPVH